MSEIHNNAQLQRFELDEFGALAFADYRREGGVVFIDYVFAAPAQRGKGTAGRLMKGMLEQIRREGLKVQPICGYAVAYIQRHPEEQDLLA